MISDIGFVALAIGMSLMSWAELTGENDPPCETITINDVEYIPVDCEVTTDE